MSTIATYIRNQAYARLTTGAISSNWVSTHKSPIPTRQGDQLPALGVYLMGEVLTPDGDANVSVPRFVSDVVLGISVLHLAENPEALDGKLDTLVDLIEDTLLQDISFVSLKGEDGKDVIESFPQIQRRYSYPQNGESYYAEVRLQITVRFRCYFEPKATTPLTEVDVHVSPFDNTAQSGEYSLAIPLEQ